MSLLKVDDTINNSFRKSFLGSLEWFLGVKIDSEKSNFAYLKCITLPYTEYEWEKTEQVPTQLPNIARTLSDAKKI